MTVFAAIDADAILTAARHLAGKLGVAVTIVIADAAGLPLALHRMDGAKGISAEVAQAKARCSALFGMRTSVFQQAAAGNPGIVTVPHVVCAGGGVPIKRDGTCIGAVAVSGASAEQDEEIALAGLAALA